MQNLYDIQAEREVIASCFKDWQVSTNYLMRFNPEHFSDPILRSIFSQIKLHTLNTTTNPTIFNIASKLENEKVTVEYLLNLKENYFYGDPKDIIERIERTYSLRQAVNISHHFLQTVEGIQPDEIKTKILHQGEKFIELWKDKDDDDTKYRVGDNHFSVYDEALKAQENYKKGILPTDIVPTGYADIDKYLVGFKAGRLSLIAARPRVGKTTFMTNLIRNMPHRKIMVFTAEMTWKEQLTKLLVMESGVAFNKIQSGNLNSDELGSIYSAEKRLRTKYKDLVLDETTRPKPSDIKMKCKRYQMAHGLDIVFVDHIGLLGSDKKTENRVMELEEISKSMKEMAKELNVPVVCLAQLNRDFEKIDTARAPRLSDLRGSGSLEQDADVILMLNRPDIDKPESSGENMEVYVTKNRFGGTGTIHLTMSKNTCEIKPKVTKEDQVSIYEMYR
jgi:replicative DNA helicase